MKTTKKVALPTPGTPKAKKFLNEWSAAVRRLNFFTAPEPSVQVYIPRPTSVAAFSDTLLFNVENATCNAVTPISVTHQLGGKVFTFTAPKDAITFKSLFPLTLTTKTGTHVFEVRDVPVRHEGTHIRFQGVPFTHDPSLVKLWLSSVVAGAPDNLVFHDIFKTKKGLPTDKVRLERKLIFER